MSGASRTPSPPKMMINGTAPATASGIITQPPTPAPATPYMTAFEPAPSSLSPAPIRVLRLLRFVLNRCGHMARCAVRRTR